MLAFIPFKMVFAILLWGCCLFILKCCVELAMLDAVMKKETIESMKITHKQTARKIFKRIALGLILLVTLAYLDRVYIL